METLIKNDLIKHEQKDDKYYLTYEGFEKIENRPIKEENRF